MRGASVEKDVQSCKRANFVIIAYFTGEKNVLVFKELIN